MKRNTKIFVYTVLAVIFLSLISLGFKEGVFGQERYDGKCNKFIFAVDAEDGKKIREIISTMANTSTFGLLFKKSHLKKLGNAVDKHVPPFEFLAYIFSDPDLAKSMARIQKSSFKYNGFLEGLQKNLMIVEGNGCMSIKADGFSKFLGLDPRKTKLFLAGGVTKAQKGNNKAFRSFVDYLIEEKSK